MGGRRMKKRRPKPTMTPAQALAAMRAQAVSKEALARGDKAMQERKPAEPVQRDAKTHQ